MLWISKLIKTTLNLFTFKKKGLDRKRFFERFSENLLRKDCRSGGTMTTCRVSLQTFPLNSCPASHLSRYSSFTFYLLLAFLFYLLPPYPSHLPFYFGLFLVFPFTIYICPTKHQKKQNMMK